MVLFFTTSHCLSFHCGFSSSARLCTQGTPAPYCPFLPLASSTPPPPLSRPLPLPLPSQPLPLPPLPRLLPPTEMKMKAQCRLTAFMVILLQATASLQAASTMAAVAEAQKLLESLSWEGGYCPFSQPLAALNAHALLRLHRSATAHPGLFVGF